MLWYVGPMNHTRGLDFTGSANGSNTLQFAALYLVMAAALFAVAVFGRGKSLSES